MPGDYGTPAAPEAMRFSAGREGKRLLAMDFWFAVESCALNVEANVLPPSSLLLFPYSFSLSPHFHPTPTPDS